MPFFYKDTYDWIENSIKQKSDKKDIYSAKKIRENCNKSEDTIIKYKNVKEPNTNKSIPDIYFMNCESAKILKVLIRAEVKSFEKCIKKKEKEQKKKITKEIKEQIKNDCKREKLKIVKYANDKYNINYNHLTELINSVIKQLKSIQTELEEKVKTKEVLSKDEFKDLLTKKFDLKKIDEEELLNKNKKFVESVKSFQNDKNNQEGGGHAINFWLFGITLTILGLGMLILPPTFVLGIGFILVGAFFIFLATVATVEYFDEKIKEYKSDKIFTLTGDIKINLFIIYLNKIINIFEKAIIDYKELDEINKTNTPYKIEQICMFTKQDKTCFTDKKDIQFIKKILKNMNDVLEIQVEGESESKA